MGKRLKNLLKSNFLVYLAPKWNGSRRISVDCQKMLFSSENDIGERFLLVTFL